MLAHDDVPQWSNESSSISFATLSLCRALPPRTSPPLSPISAALCPSPFRHLLFPSFPPPFSFCSALSIHPSLYLSPFYRHPSNHPSILPSFLLPSPPHHSPTDTASDLTCSKASDPPQLLSFPASLNASQPPATQPRAASISFISASRPPASPPQTKLLAHSLSSVCLSLLPRWTPSPPPAVLLLEKEKKKKNSFENLVLQSISIKTITSSERRRIEWDRVGIESLFSREEQSAVLHWRRKRIPPPATCNAGRFDSTA